jgi:hypothetical protein
VRNEGSVGGADAAGRVRTHVRHGVRSTAGAAGCVAQVTLTDAGAAGGDQVGEGHRAVL